MTTTTTTTTPAPHLDTHTGLVHPMQSDTDRVTFKKAERGVYSILSLSSLPSPTTKVGEIYKNEAEGAWVIEWAAEVFRDLPVGAQVAGTGRPCAPDEVNPYLENYPRLKDAKRAAVDFLTFKTLPRFDFVDYRITWEKASQDAPRKFALWVGWHEDTPGKCSPIKWELMATSFDRRCLVRYAWQNVDEQSAYICGVHGWAVRLWRCDLELAESRGDHIGTLPGTGHGVSGHAGREFAHWNAYGHDDNVELSTIVNPPERTPRPGRHSRPDVVAEEVIPADLLIDEDTEAADVIAEDLAAQEAADVIEVKCGACGHSHEYLDNGWSRVVCLPCGAVVDHPRRLAGALGVGSVDEAIECLDKIIAALTTYRESVADKARDFDEGDEEVWVDGVRVN